jgi:hypothetical protein
VLSQHRVDVRLREREQVSVIALFIEHHALDQRRALLREGRGQRCRVRDGAVAEPHGVEALQLRTCARVGQHALGFGKSLTRLRERVALGLRQQRVVGRAAPEQVGEACRDLVAAQRADTRLLAGRAYLDAIEKLGIL